jgi:hypothetical protein
VKLGEALDQREVTAHGPSSAMLVQ